MTPGTGHRPSGHRRLAALITAGLVDSLCLSVAWTVLVLRIADEHGLAAVGVVSAAMLVGVALSAPIAGRVAVQLDGRRLLRTAAGVEMVLRVGLALLVVSGAPVLVLALCTTAMNVSAWTGYAGMRAEVAAVRPGAAALTWYGTAIAAVEAAGVAVAAFLPTGTRVEDTVFVAVVIAYVLGLLPTVVVAGASPVRRAARAAARTRLQAPPGLAVLGALLMLLGSAPTLLYVALAEEAHGRTAVAAAAVAFVAGSLLAGPAASALQRRRGPAGPRYALAAVGMVAGWVVAPVSVPLLCAAQVLSGLCMTLLEGLLDSTAAAREPQRVTAALASVTAGRALGSAAGTAVLPLVVLQTGLPVAAAGATAGLLVLAALTIGLQRRPSTSAHRGDVVRRIPAASLPPVPRPPARVAPLPVG